jgi:hypothetical protein
MLSVNGGQTGCHLRCNFERQLSLQPAGAFDEILKRFPFYKLHCVEITIPGSTQMEHGRNIRMTNARRCTGFAEKAKPRRFIAEVSLADDLQSHGAAQIDVERLVIPIAPRPNSSGVPSSPVASS